MDGKITDEPLLDLDESGLWLSISDIAKMKDISRQAVAKRVADLVEAGKVRTRPGDNGTKLVNLAQYNRAIGETGDAFKEQAAETKAVAADDAPQGSVLRDAQARGAAYTADLRYLELQERLGKLVPIDNLADAANRCAEIMVQSIDRITTHADAMAAAVGKEGAAGARGKFKEIARQLRAEIAEAFGALAGEAVPLTLPQPESDETDA